MQKLCTKEDIEMSIFGYKEYKCCCSWYEYDKIFGKTVKAVFEFSPAFGISCITSSSKRYYTCEKQKVLYMWEAHIPWHGFSAWKILDCHGGAWDLSDESSKISLNYKARMLDKQTFLRYCVSMEYGIFFRASFKRFLLYQILILK